MVTLELLFCVVRLCLVLFGRAEEALLQPVDTLKAMERAGDNSSRLAYTQEFKAMPFALVWNMYCARKEAGVGLEWLKEVKAYEADVLAKRLEARGYGPDKVRENVQAEVLDVILCEATESEIPVYEVDCTSSSVSESADSVEKILNGDVSDYLPGKTDWSGEMDRWF